MPQRAILDGVDVVAWEMGEAEWTRARQAGQSERLWMGCCGGRAVAKTSPQGLRFFAHRSDLGWLQCAWRGESLAHERLKAAACRAASAMGFRAATEVVAPDRSWRADCLIWDSGGHPRLAVEIQLSSIAPEEIERRTSKLTRDTPLVAWMLGRRLKAALVRPTPKRSLVTLPAMLDEAEREVLAHVTGLLTGDIAWIPDRIRTHERTPFRLVGYREICKACGFRYGFMPVVWLMRNTNHPSERPYGIWSSTLPADDLRQALAAYSCRTGMPTALVAAVRHLRGGRQLCPKCRAPAQDSAIGPDFAPIWPGRTADGWTDHAYLIPSAVHGHWGAAAPVASAVSQRCEAPPNPQRWRTALQNALARQNRQLIHGPVRTRGQSASSANAVAVPLDPAELRRIERAWEMLLTGDAGEHRTAGRSKRMRCRL